MPIARWKGFGGELNSREWSYETLTFAAGLAGFTRNIALLSRPCTCRCAHPVFVAKAPLATVDRASNGRAGLNIVCGWNPEEFGMFGLEMIDNRYTQGLEWFEIVSRIYNLGVSRSITTAPSTSSRNVSGKLALPAATAAPDHLECRLLATRAANSRRKQRTSLFTTFTEIDKGAEHIEDMQARAAARRRAGRIGAVFTTASWRSADASQAEAEDRLSPLRGDDGR